MTDCYNMVVQPDAVIDLELRGAHVRFTGRAGGVSEGDYASLNLSATSGDDPAAVAENRRRAADGRPVAAVHQVHGTRVVVVGAEGGAGAALGGVEEDDAGAALAGAEEGGAGAERAGVGEGGAGAERVRAAATPHEEADGLVTARDGLALMVLTADCLPVALATPAAVAMLHAGWRGLTDGVLEEGVRALRALDPDGAIHAAIGPGAGACCYEVGDEVGARFPPSARAGRRIDLKAVAAQRLRDAGVAQVLDVARCTMCDPETFFSHRASSGGPGRQAGLIWRLPCPS